MDSYEELLNKAYEKLPQQSLETTRFEIPKVRGHIQGNNTIISNFHQIADTLQRTPEHILKFVLKELATPGELKKSGVIIGTKIPASRINEKIERYTEEFVICKQCKKPDTKLTKEGNYTFLKCMACGSKYSV
ncbi:translation initiation factor IF-2 subunit beta [Candidatus Woesearchaeota archaeon]|nr:translation initiation factor IF-2 subunit beta [Candidatus Woesearchaeota archaeon]